MHVTDFVRQFENALDGVSPGSLKPESRFRELPEWSSLAALTLIAVTDAEYGVELSAEDIKQSQTVQDIFQVILSKKK
jgi:acyl carrier protein